VSPGHHLRPQRVLGIILLVAVTLTGCAGGNTAAPTSPTTSTAVVPRADKPVSYLGLTIDVPRSWTVAERVDAFCGIPGPGVIVGASPPPQKTLIQCAAVLLRGTVVTLGGPDDRRDRPRHQNVGVGGPRRHPGDQHHLAGVGSIPLSRGVAGDEGSGSDREVRPGPGAACVGDRAHRHRDSLGSRSP
jgi:hypothetical protein